MIDFSKSAENRRRQDSVWVGGIEYGIHTAFFHWIAFEKKLEGRETVSLEELDWLYARQAPQDKMAGYGELVKFYKNEQPLPRPGKETGITGIDWQLDSEYIRAAFLQQYGIDLLAAEVHWHDFIALFNALTDTKLNQIMAARYDESKKGPMHDMRKAWEIIKTVKKPVMNMV